MSSTLQLPRVYYVIVPACVQSRGILERIRTHHTQDIYPMENTAITPSCAFSLFVHDGGLRKRTQHGKASRSPFLRLESDPDMLKRYGVPAPPSWTHGAMGYIAVRRLSDIEWEDETVRERQAQALREMHIACTRIVRRLSQSKEARMRPEKRERQAS